MMEITKLREIIKKHGACLLHASGGRAILPRKTSTKVATVIITISLIVLVLLGVGGSGTLIDGQGPSRREFQETGKTTWLTPATRPTPLVNYKLTTLPEVYKKTTDNAHYHQTHYTNANAASYIRFQPRWTIISFLRDVTKSVTLCAEDVTFANLIQRSMKLQEIVKQGEEALGGSVTTGRSNVDPNTEANQVNLASRAWIFEMVVEAEHARIRAALAGRIDNYLASRGSPLAGLGRDFVWAQERTGVSATLMVGLTGKESTFGTNGYLCTQNHNCFGMKGPQPQLGISAQGGWCWWPDYGSSIQGAADFIVYYWGQAQTAYDLHGYCEGNPSDWFQTVEAVRKEI